MTTLSTQPTAATQFFNLPELVRFVAELSFRPYQHGVIPTLASLRLVNWTCNLAATPYAFLEMRISDSIAHTRSRCCFNPRPDLVRRALFSRYEAVDDEEEKLRALISQMSRLESFVYNGSALTPALLETLKISCPDLKVLHINYQDNFRPRQNCRLDFDGFCGLRELMLYNLPFSDHPRNSRHSRPALPFPVHDWWIPRLARLLIGSPALKELSLGLLSQSNISQSDRCMSTFDKLCHLYKTGGGLPLPLESLEFPGGLFPYDINPLKDLVNLTSLHDVFIHDTSHSSVSPPLREVAWEAFAPPHAPNLRNFRALDYHPVLHKHLCDVAATNPSFLRRLAIACKYRHIGTGLDPFALLRPDPLYPALPLQVRMIDLDFFCERTYGKVHVSKADVLEDLVTTNGDTLEGLAVSLVDYERVRRIEHSLGLLEKALGRLPRLEQLSVGTLRGLVPDLTVAERLAAAAGPRLRYLSVGGSFMRVRRNGDPVLEMMSPLEADGVELWKYSLIDHTATY